MRPLSEVSDDVFFSAGSRTSTNGPLTTASSFYSLTNSSTSSDQQPTTTGISYTSSETPLASSDSEGAMSDRHMRRVNLSPSGSTRHSNESYSEENSMEETAEVEAALNDLDHEFDSTEDMLTEWSRGTSSGGPSYTGTTPSYSTSLDTYSIYNRDGQRLSTISERTENIPSRPTSYLRDGARPANPTPEGHRLSAFFEDRATTPSDTAFAHSRTTSVPGYRTQSPFFPLSQSTPHLGSTTGYGSCPSSPAKSKVESVSSASSSVSDSLSTSSLLAPPIRGATTSRSGTQLSPSDFASTFSNTFTASRSATNTSGFTPPVSSLRRPQTSPRSPLTSVRNIVAAWKERTPALGKNARSPTESTSPTSKLDSLFSLRRRAERGESGERPLIGQPSAEPGNIRPSPPKSMNSSIIPPPFDMTELGAYARDSREPLRIGVLWYLNVHSGPPYRWQRCEALLYPHMLLLSWIAPGGGRGVVTLDLLNCTEVRSVPSPTHSSAREDVGTIAAKAQTEEGSHSLVETLCPFQLLYTDGVERLAAESARERVRWVSAIWEALDRSVSLPNRSEPGSPAGSIRTILSMTSTTSVSGSGSASTVFVPPLHTIPSLSDLHTFSDSSSTGSRSRAPSFPTHHTRTTDDGAVSNQSYLYPGDPRVIAPSRSSSLRRTSSLTDLDAEFASAVTRARTAKPGLGFGLGLVGGAILGDGSPVTVSSGPRLGADVRVTPPPSAKAKMRPLSEVSDDAFFSAGSRTSTNGPHTTTSSFYSLTNSSTSSDQQPTTTGIITDETAFEFTSGGSNTQIVPSTLSYRRTESNSYLGDSHDGSYTYSSYTTTSPSRSSLSRTSEVRRRRYSRSYMGSEEISDKENTTTGYPPSQSRSTLSTWTRSRSTTPTPAPSTAALSVLDIPDSSGSEGYQTANSPSTASFKSLPTIPSESDYNTAEVCKTESSTEFLTAERCVSDISTEYVTAEKCKTETETEFVTAELCECDRSTQYETASVCKTIPSEASTPRSLTVDLPVERAPTPPPKTPSVVPSIASPESEVPPEIFPEQVPLPQTEFSPTISEVSRDFQPEQPEEVEVMPPSIVSTSETALSPTPSLEESSRSPTRSLTEPSEIVVSDLSASESEASLPSLASTEPTPTPSVHPSQWAPETDISYDSSHLQPTPFSQSAQLQEGRDISFETSFMRPSVSPLTSLGTLTPITETISSSASPPVPSSPLRFAPPTAITQPVSSPSSGPTPLTLSSTESSTLSRTPSSVSDIPSISTDIVEDDVVSLSGAQAASEISTVPSLLSSHVSNGSVHYLPNPTMVPLPPSPMPSESPPAASISVSLTTPQSNVPSIHSVLETEPPRSHTETITHDIDRILHHIHELDRFRGQESQEIAENVRIVRDELYDLSDYVRTHLVSSERVVSQRTPISCRDQSVGGSSIVSDGRLAPAGPRSRPGLIPIPLTPPPHFTRTLSVSSGSSRGSYLSSHHSDDISLLGTPEVLELSTASPSWSSEPSSFSSDLSPSVISSSEPSPGPSLSVTSSSSSPTPPPSSPTPSTASSSTARPVEGITLVSIRDILTQLREQTTALWDGQMSTNHMLDELRQSRPIQPDNTEIHTRLQNIERLLETMVTRRREVEEETSRVHDSTRVRRTRVDSVSETSDALAELESLRSRWEEISSQRGRVHIHAPAPRPAGPSLDEQLLELLGAPPTQAPTGVQQPPPLIPFTYQPAPRPSRSRSPSPILRRETAPPLAEPIWSPETLHARPLRPRPPRREPIRRTPTIQPEPQAMYDIPPMPEHPPRRVPIPDVRPTTEQPERRPSVLPAGPVLPPSLHEPIPPRPPTAPATLGGVEDAHPSASWYRPRRAGPGVVPPPGIVEGPPQTGAQQAQPPSYIPMPPGPTIVQMPLFDTLMAILREHRLAQLATVDQQRELMRYMHGLNQWLERDVHDRQAELRSVTARLDQLRADVLGRLGVGLVPGERMQMPEPQPAQPGPFVVPPVPAGAAAGPVPPPPLVGHFPVGFVPQGAPQPPVIPSVARTPSPFTPVIPQAPPGWMGMPVPGGYPGPVIPPGISHDVPPAEQIYVHRPEQQDEVVVLGSSPPPSSDGTPAPRPIVVHPPAQPGGTVIIPPSQTGERESRSSTPTQESYHPLPSPAAIPVPAGPHEVPTVIPVPPSVSHHTTPPQTTIVNVGPPMGPQFAPIPQVPPPGQIQVPIPEAVAVPGSGVGGQYGMPMPGMGPQPPLIIQPPVQLPGTIYSPSRTSSRTSERTRREPVIVVPGSREHSPPPVVVQAPPTSHVPHVYDDHAIRRSPSIHAFPEGHPPTVTPPVIVNVPTGGSRHRSPSYSPTRRSRSYSPEREDGHPRRLHRRRHPDDYSPEGGRRRRSRSYSPEDRHPRRHHEGPYSPVYSEGDRRRHRHEPRPRDDYSPDDERRRRRRDGYSPEDERRRRRRDSYSPEDRRRRRRRDDYSPEDEGHRRRRDERSPEDGGRPRRRDDYSPEDSGRRRYRREYSPDDDGRRRRRPTYSPEAEDRDVDRPRPILSEGRPHHRPEYIEGDGGPPYTQPPHAIVPPSPLPPTVIRIGGEPPEHEVPQVIISPSQRPFSPERRPLSPRSQLGHELRQVRPGDTYIPTAPSEAGGRRPPRPPTSMPDAPELRPHPSARGPSPERSDFHRTPSPGGFPPEITERPPSDIVHHVPPPPHGPSQVYPGPGDVAFEDALRAQHERLDDALIRMAEDAHTAENQREEEFRQGEEARDRIFHENEDRREAEARQRGDALFQQLEERVASVPPLPVPPPHDAERASIIESITAAQDAASRHASDIMDTVRMEREDMAREREALAAERERDRAELDAARQRLDEECRAKIAALEEELARVHGELESERQLRMTEENEARMAAAERDEALRAQLSDLTNVVQQNHTLCEEKKALMDEHWADKQRWKEERDRQMAELMGMVSRLVEEQAAARQREEEQRQANEGKPGVEQVLEELQRQNAEQRELLNVLSDNWRTESIRQHEETINAVRATANEQVPYNVQGYLDEFSKALATEVRMLLNEVGKLREERRNIQHELAYLLDLKSRYEPGGEFHPDWKPPMPSVPPPEAPQPPPEAPPPPEDMPPARPAWRSVHPTRGRRIRKKTEAPPPEPAPEPRQATTSWATWQPNPAFAPTPPSVEPTLLVPDRGSPGLFGPRSPRSSYHA